MPRDIDPEQAIDLFLAQGPSKAETKQFIMMAINATIKQATDATPVGQLQNALATLRANKPKDPGELTRHYAVAITQLEIVIAYVKFYLSSEQS